MTTTLSRRLLAPLAAAAWLASALPAPAQEPQAMAAGADHSQGRCRLLPDGGQARLSGARGPQGRAARGEGRPDRHEGAAVRRGRELRRRSPARSPQTCAAPTSSCSAAPGTPRPTCMLARPGIAKMEDLRGKSIAASSPGTPPEMVARAALMRCQDPAFGGQACGGRAAIATASARSWPASSTPRWSPTNICRCRA